MGKNKILTGTEQSFVNTLAEDIIFEDWIDESCGNFVGWIKDYSDFTIAIHREDTAIGGFYHFAKMKKGYHSSFDYKSNLISEIYNLSLLKITNVLNSIS